MFATNLKAELPPEDSEIMRQALVRFATVRIGTEREFPFFGRGIHGMVPIPVWKLREREGGAAWAMDKYGRVYFDPEILVGPDAEPIKASVATFAHEVMHWLFLHWLRLEGMGLSLSKHLLMKANYAMDAPINDHPYQRKHLPNGIFPESLKHKDTMDPLPPNEAWEWYFEHMYWPEEEEGGQKPPPPPPPPGRNPPPPGRREDEDCPPVSGGNPDPEDEDSEEEEDCPPGGGKNPSPEGEDPCPPGNGPPSPEKDPNIPDNPLGGDLPGVEERDWELPPPTDDGEIPGIHPDQADEIRRDVARTIQQESSRSRGNIPGSWAEWAEQEIAPPKVPWQSKLQNLIREARDRALGCSNFTYSKRSRRQGCVDSNVIIPAVYRPKVDVAVVIDTSSSVSTPDLDLACSEASGIFRAVGAAVSVVTGDTRVGFAKKITKVSDIELVGRCGTDMRPLLQKALEFNPQCIVLFTDGFTPWPRQQDFRIPVVVALIGNNCGEDGVPPWMHTIIVEE